ncbi:MAG: cobalamin biosynthesis protein [Eubacteriales bacterium]
MKEWVATGFADSTALIFVGATGIAVRAIAPHLKSKTTDPAVLVLDDCGKFCISLVSGHLGGANALCRAVADWIGATAVITTATDNNGVFAVDTWAKSQGMKIMNPEAIKNVSSKLLAGETIRVKSDFPVAGSLPKGLILTTEKPFDLEISIKKYNNTASLRLLPPVCALGVGCRKYTELSQLEEAFSKIMGKSHLDEASVFGAFSIDLKAEEAGLLDFCASRNLPFVTYSAGALNRAEGNFTASAFVQKTTGTDNVCERSAVLGSQGRLISKKNAGNGVTMAIAIRDFTVQF